MLSEAGELNNGRVFPGWNTGGLPVPEGSDSEHITRYGDGTEIRYDRAAHALTITLAEGGTYKIIGKERSMVRWKSPTPSQSRRYANQFRHECEGKHRCNTGNF